MVDFFSKKSDMLEDYFSMKIDENGCLASLPVLLELFTPDLDRLPMFILRLVTEVIVYHSLLYNVINND